MKGQILDDGILDIRREKLYRTFQKLQLFCWSLVIFVATLNVAEILRPEGTDKSAVSVVSVTS